MAVSFGMGQSDGLLHGFASTRSSIDGRTALVMADTRHPWPPPRRPDSTSARVQLNWQPSYYSYAVAISSMYAQRHCYDLRIYQFVGRLATTRVDSKLVEACTHPQLGSRAAPWCKLVALYDTLNATFGAKQTPSLYEYVVWVDSDVYFNDASVSIDQLVRLPLASA